MSHPKMPLTLEQDDYLTEVINIGMGKAVSILNEMTDIKVNLCVPKVQLLPISEVISHFKNTQKMVTVKLSFNGEFAGDSLILFPQKSGEKLVELLTGEVVEEDDSSGLTAEVLTEVGNIVLNSMVGSLANIFISNFTYSVPLYEYDTPENIITKNQRDEFSSSYALIATTNFNMDDNNIQGDILMLFNVSSITSFINEIDQQLKDVA